MEGKSGGWNMATYVNCLYIPIPYALTSPTPADVAAS